MKFRRIEFCCEPINNGFKINMCWTDYDLLFDWVINVNKILTSSVDIRGFYAAPFDAIHPITYSYDIE